MSEKIKKTAAEMIDAADLIALDPAAPTTPATPAAPAAPAAPTAPGASVEMVTAADLIALDPAAPTTPAAPATPATPAAPAASATPVTPAAPGTKRGRGRPLGSKKRIATPVQDFGGEIPPADFSDISPGETETQTAELTPEQAATDYTALANITFDTGVGVLTLVFGQEWQSQNDSERSAVVKSLQSYYVAKQVKDIPPGVMLSIVCLAYAAPRLKHPNTSGKIKNAWLWFKVKILRRKLTTT